MHPKSYAYITFGVHYIAASRFYMLSQNSGSIIASTPCLESEAGGEYYRVVVVSDRS